MRRSRLRRGLAVLGVVAAACGSARRGEPIAGPLRLESDVARRGRRVFMEHCHACHPGGEAGTGPSLNDKPVPAFLVRAQVRHGIGAMPSFAPAKLDDRALDDLVAYFRVLRRHGA